MGTGGTCPVYGSPTLRAMHSIHKCVAKGAPHLLAVLRNEPRIGIVKTAMGACAQIAVFTYAVMRRTPRYEIRLVAFFAGNLMNSVAHCAELPINVERPLRHIYELSAWLVT